MISRLSLDLPPLPASAAATPDGPLASVERVLGSSAFLCGGAPGAASGAAARSSYATALGETLSSSLYAEPATANAWGTDGRRSGGVGGMAAWQHDRSRGVVLAQPRPPRHEVPSRYALTLGARPSEPQRPHRIAAAPARGGAGQLGTEAALWAELLYRSAKVVPELPRTAVPAKGMSKGRRDRERLLDAYFS